MWCLAKALALVEAHGLLELRPVGNLVLFRAAKKEKRGYVTASGH
ncbi:hypothetical protein [Deinococcus aquatilis]|nr:hypothetical protein [Deinococcus aquatilis]